MLFQFSFLNAEMHTYIIHTPLKRYMAIYFLFGLPVGIFKVVVISFAKFLKICVIYEIWKEN